MLPPSPSLLARAKCLTNPVFLCFPQILSFFVTRILGFILFGSVKRNPGWICLEKKFVFFFQLCRQVGGPIHCPKEEWAKFDRGQTRRSVELLDLESCLVLATYLNSLSKHGDFELLFSSKYGNFCIVFPKKNPLFNTSHWFFFFQNKLPKCNTWWTTRYPPKSANFSSA
jgi:hypothetical protein